MSRTKKLFSRRDRQTEQVLSRLDSIECTYNSVSDADPEATRDRLRRLRYGTKRCKQGEPALNLGR